jgi:hypothetical protein
VLRSRLQAKFVALATVLGAAALGTAWILAVRPNRTVPVSASGLHAIVVRPKAAGTGIDPQMVTAGCAKGFVRRGSVCEREAQMLARTKPLGQQTIRPPERE